MKKEDEEGVRRSESKSSESLPLKPLLPVGLEFYLSKIIIFHLGSA
jgi:hypothetical protein